MSALTRTELLARLKALRPWLTEQGIGRVRLFGSYARDQAGPDSDVDLIVELTEPMGLRFFDIEDALSKQLGVKVQMATERALPSDVRYTALRDAVDA